MPIQLFLGVCFLKNVAVRCDFSSSEYTKMRMRMRPGLRPGPTGENYRAPIPLAGFQGGSHFAAAEGRKGEGNGGKEEKGRG